MGKQNNQRKQCAYVACAGGERDHTCRYGCTGCASCVEVCKKQAIKINTYGVAEVDPGKCVGCRLCEKACPQGIIHMRSAAEVFFVRCSNREKGAEARKACEASCIACGLCEKNCPSEAARVEDGCARIWEETCLSCGNCVVSCPRGVIYDARGIIRKETR